MRLALVVALVVCIPFPARADGLPSGFQERLVEVEDGGEIAPVARWLDQQGADPVAVAEALRRGSIHARSEGRDFEIEVRARSGLRTVARVLVPAAYDPETPAGLLIALHGARGDQDQLAGTYRKATELGWLVAMPAARPGEACCDPAAELFKNLTGGAWWDYSPEGVVFGTFDEMKRRFNVDEDRVVLTGYSMGGFASWNIGLRHHALFAGVAPISGALSLIEYTGLRDERSRSLLENATNGSLFVLHGAEDPVVPAQPDRWSHSQLDELGVAHVFHLVAGGSHRTTFFRGEGAEYAEFWTWLAGRRRDPGPDRMVHVAIDDDHLVGDWIEILEARTRPRAARVEAARTGGNRIEIETERVNRLRVYLHPDDVDVSRPVTILRDGRKAFEGVIEPSHESVLSSWRAFRGDRRKVTAHAVELGR